METVAEKCCEHAETVLLYSIDTDHVSSFRTAFEDLSLCQSMPEEDHAVEDCDVASTAAGRSDQYYSPRIERMMQSRSQFSDEVELGIEFSRSHWSDVSDELDDEEVNQENREVFQELTQEYSSFFKDLGGRYKLGRKIAEGGQAGIFEAIDLTRRTSCGELLKVFKRGTPLKQLKLSWPLGVLREEVRHVIDYGTMLEDGRFAFVMWRCWGDLRKLIDQAMQKKCMQGPPFPIEWDGVILLAEYIMLCIAMDMEDLHKKGILHRDLKASNILCKKTQRIILADFECSIGVMGTSFWRAPEILLALKNKETVIFTEKADVYSFGMTCFEIVTGRLPFEDEHPNKANNDLIIKGRRPDLPNHLDAEVKDLITKCWAPNPHQRPKFHEIKKWLLELLDRMYGPLDWRYEFDHQFL